MSSSRVRFKKPPSKRQVMAWTAFASGDLSQMPAYREPVKRGKQPESASNDAVQEWAKAKGGLLHRNRRGMVDLPGGGKMPFGLGPNGYGDNVGYLTMTITPEMLGRKIAVYTMVECKRADKAIKKPEEYGHQFTRIEEVRDAGGIAGFARHAEDCETILRQWKEKR